MQAFLTEHLAYINIHTHTYIRSPKEIHVNFWSVEKIHKKPTNKPQQTNTIKGQALFLLLNNSNTTLAVTMCREELSRFITHSNLAFQTNTGVKLVFSKTNGL